MGGVGVSSKKPSNTATPGPTKNLSSKQVHRIWGEMKAQTVLERLKTLWPTHRWTLHGSRVSGLCPLHDDSTPSFHIYLDRGYAKCFGCDTYITNPIELWSKLAKLSYSDALHDLKLQFGLKFLGTNVQTQLKAWDRNQHLKRRIMQICHDELINAINDPASHPTAQATVDWLLNVRQVPKDAIPALDMLGVVPPLATIRNVFAKEHLAEQMKAEAEAEANGTKAVKITSLEQEAADYMAATSPGWVGSVIFRLDLSPNIIGRLKVRRANSKDIIFLEDRYEEELGFFGLGWQLYRNLLTTQHKYIDSVYVVEGEFDTLSSMARQVLAGGPNFISVAAGGKSNAQTIDDLYQCGFNKVYLVGDAPSNSGDVLVETWLPGIKNLRAYVFTGYDQFPGQCDDPDKIVCTVGLDAYQRVLLDTDNRKRFQTPPDWVFDRAYPEVAAINDSDVRFRIETLAKWGRLLKNNVECDLFVDASAKAFAIPSAQLKREIVARAEDEPGFVLRLVDVLNQVFFPVGQQATDKDRKLVLWHRDKREVTHVSLADDGSIERELGRTLGPSYQFFQEKVGIPSFLEIPETLKEGGKYLQRLDKDCRFYYRQALTIMSQSVPDMDIAKHLGQGLHVIGPQATPTLYLVNGKDIFIGTFVEGGKLSWKKADGPTHDGYIFDVGFTHPEEVWLKSVASIDDLNRAEKVDPKSLWTRLRDVIDTGWAFKNHQITLDFLTAHLLATTIQDAWRRKVVVAFHADTSAGKSKMNMGLIAGVDHEHLQLISSAVGFQSFTTAGVRDAMKNKAMTLCLDEFEDDGSGDKKSRIVTDTLALLRNLTGEKNSHVMSSRSLETKRIRISFFCFLSAIHPARRVQDANRMVVINMQKVEGKLDPADVLPQKFGQTALTQLREDLDVGLMPHIGKLRQMYDETRLEYAGNKPIPVEQRFFEALYPAIAVMKFLGLDYKKFVLDFCEANKTPLMNSAEHTDSAALFSWILQAPQLKIRTGENRERNDASCLQLLTAPDLREQINTSASGLFFDEDSQLLVVNWTMAIQGVLREHDRYKRETSIFNLREIANRSPYAVRAEELLQSGALARLKRFGLISVPAAHLTAYKVGHIISGAEESTPQAPASTEKPAERKTDDGEFTAA